MVIAMSENLMISFDYSALSVSGDDVAFLEDCARGVEAGLKITVEGILEIGRALCAARDRLNGSKPLFGQWRQGRLPWLARHTACNFIQVFERFGSDFPLENNSTLEVSPTILYQLSDFLVKLMALLPVNQGVSHG